MPGQWPALTAEKLQGYSHYVNLTERKTFEEVKYGRQSLATYNNMGLMVTRISD